MGSEIVLVVVLIDYPSSVLPPVTMMRRLLVIIANICLACNFGRVCAK